MTAGDYDYDRHGEGYAGQRRADPRIARHVHDALGDARTVLNVGAGAGSYEPDDRDVTAVEPSATMRAQRPAHLPPAVDATADALPFDDDAFDAAMATITVHQWPDPAAGLRELRRVASDTVVVLTFDIDAFGEFWLAHYVPELIEADRSRFPSIDEVRNALGGRTTVTSVPVPEDCTDGFIEAFYGRPERLLEERVRRAQSGWAFLAPGIEDRAVQHLLRDLESGDWDAEWGHLRDAPSYDGALRLVAALPD